jgi:hypothetical protein
MMSSLGRRCTAYLIACVALSACGDSQSDFTLGAEAGIDYWPTSLVFTDVVRDAEAVRTVTLEHIGSGGAVVLESVRLETNSPDLAIGIVEATTIGPGERTRIQIVYTSAHDQPDEGELVIRLNIATQQEIRIPIWTPGQRAALVTEPPSVDFGIVQAGAPKTVPVIVTNIGTAPAALTGFATANDPDGDFSVEIPDGLTIEPNASVTVGFTYTPSGQNKDKGAIILETDRSDVTLMIAVEGQEETPLLVTEPATVQFSWVEPGGTKLATIKLRNDGNAPLIVWSLYLADGAMEGVGLTNPPAMPLELLPGDVYNMGALFSPVEEHAMTGEPLAVLVLESTDAAHNPLEVPLYGAAGVPDIMVVPEDVVDFAYVASGFAAKRAVTVLNIGNEPVTINAATLEDPTSDEFGLNVSTLPAVLNPSDSVVFDVLFENRGGDEGTEFARLMIETTDKLVPMYPLDVVARRSERPTCEPAFVPDILSLGAFKPGTSGTGVLHLVNYGSGNCEYRDWDLLGCTSAIWGIRTEFTCDPLFPYTPFEVTLAPPTNEVVGPGESVFFEITFTAPPVVHTDVGRDNYFARIALTMHDPNLNVFKYVAPPGGWAAGINLRAQSALPLINVDPSVIDYGTVRTGCESDAATIQVTNLGPMAAIVTKFEAEGCDGELLIVNPPTTPYELPGYQTLFVEVLYTPSDAGEDACHVIVESDSVNLPYKKVDLGGDAIDVEHQIDTFLQEPTPKVDVLFVVDDSGSMADDQVLLKQELPNLVAEAASWGQDYHMAVTTTDPLLVSGRFKGVPSWVNDTVDTSVFADNLLVGTGGHWEEMGLNGAWMAFSGNNVASTSITCINAPNACPSGLWCQEGFCSGPNVGFLREDADLVILLISDEEDSSPETTDWYIEHFASLKDPQTGYGVKVHALVHDDQCLGAGYGTKGTRYIEVVKQFDGYVGSLCTSNFTAEFDAIAEKTFGLKDQFYPSLPPDPATIVIRVDGAPCTTGWEWNSETKAIVFDIDGACFPNYGEQVEIEYDVYCNQSSN